MPPYPMMPFAVDAILRLREEASVTFAQLRVRFARRRTSVTPTVSLQIDDARPIPMPQRPARRAA